MRGVTCHVLSIWFRSMMSITFRSSKMFFSGRENLLNNMSAGASTFRQLSPSTAAFYNKRFEPLWKREGTVRFCHGDVLHEKSQLT